MTFPHHPVRKAIYGKKDVWKCWAVEILFWKMVPSEKTRTMYPEKEHTQSESERKLACLLEGAYINNNIFNLYSQT